MLSIKSKSALVITSIWLVNISIDYIVFSVPELNLLSLMATGELLRELTVELTVTAIITRSTGTSILAVVWCWSVPPNLLRHK